MFTAKDLKQLMDAKPFQPFTIRMSDGSSFEIVHHDAAFITQNYVTIGKDLDKNNIPGETVRRAIIHITQIDNLKEA